MPTFGKFQATLGSEVKIANAYAPGNQSLTLIFEGLIADDSSDISQRFSARTIDIAVELVSTNMDCQCSIELRGTCDYVEPKSLGIVRLQVAERWIMIHPEPETKELYARLVVPANGRNSFNISILLLANAGSIRGEEVLVTVTSLDLMLITTPYGDK